MLDKPYEIMSLELGPMDNLVYIIADKKTRRAAVVDPAWDVSRIFQVCIEQGYNLTDILLTHSHFDHVNGVDEVLHKTDARLHIHKIEADFWSRAGREAHLFDSDEIFSLGATEIRVCHTPGHTPGSVCYYLPGGELITGDTLFIFGCGRCNMVGGDPECMYHSLRKISESFAPETIILPGHHYGHQQRSSLAEQIQGNPFLRLTQVEDFVNYRMKLHNRSMPYEAVLGDFYP